LNGVLQYALATGGSWDWVSTGITVANGSWTHLAIVKSGTALRVHVNGAATATYTGSAPATLDNTANPMTVGGRGGACTTLQAVCGTAQYREFFQGQMSDIRFWSTARTGTQIAATYDKRLASDLITWFLDETSGSTAYNSAMVGGSALNGTYGGTTTSTDVPTMSAPTTFNVNSTSTYSGYLPGYEPSGNVTFAVGTQGTQGTVAITSATGAFTYTPLSSAVGLDSFSYTMSRSGVTSAAQTIGASIADTTSPTIIISPSPSTVTPSSSRTSTVTFTLSEASTNFTVADVSATNGTLSAFSGSGTSYTATFTATGVGPSAALSVAAGAFTDAAGNGNTSGSGSITIAATNSRTAFTGNGTIGTNGTVYVVERFQSGTTNWTVPNGVTSIDYLLVGGGGGGGGVAGGGFSSGGGGAGQVRGGTAAVTAGQTLSAVVGASGVSGGTTSIAAAVGGIGGTSSLTGTGVSLTATGGGGGAGGQGASGATNATNGASGGGGGAQGVVIAQPANGTAGQGTAGGTGLASGSGNNQSGGGGGGAGVAGGNGTSTAGGAGGAGVSNSTTGAVVNYGGGGGGGKRVTGSAGAGGQGGGGTGGLAAAGSAATANTGGGGGGAGGDGSLAGGAGGSGIVVVRYALPAVSVPDLDAGSDTGASNSDDRTTSTALTLTGSAAPGASVQLKDGGTETGSSCLANDTTGAWSCTTDTLTAGAHSLTAVSSTVLGSVVTSTSSALSVTVDSTAPTVSSFSSSTADGSYKVGDTVNVTATTSEAIQSGNTLTATLDTGATVLLTAASAGSTLTGTYTVASGQSSADLTVSSFTIGTVADTAGNAMTSTTVPTGANNIAGAKAIVVDGVAPTVASFTSAASSPTNASSITYALTFSEAVTGVAAGDFSNSGTATCTFAPGTDSGSSRTVTLTCTTGGTVIPVFASAGASDVAGNTGPASAATATTTITRDVTAPTVSSFSSSTADGSYKAGATINVTATTSEAIQSGNTLTATLDTGATVLLTAASAGTTLTGTYTVTSAQNSADLTVSSFTIGTVADTVGNAMTSTTVPSGASNIAGAKAIVIDTTAPTVSSFSSSTADGTYKQGATIDITATTSEAIQSGNTLTVTLDTGATVLLTAASAGTSLTGTYTVGASQTSSDLTVSSFTIGTVADSAGNAMTSTTVPSGTNNIAGSKAIVIDTSAPTVTLAASSATATTSSLTFTLTGNEAIDCTTLSTTAGTDFTLTNISSITSITQTSSAVCTIAVTSSATVGERLTSTLTRAGTFSVADVAGNAQTAVVGSPASVDVTRSTAATPRYPDVSGGAAVSASAGTATAIGSAFDVTDASSVGWASVTATVTTTAGTLTVAVGDSGATSASVTANTVTIKGSLAAVKNVLNSQGTAFTRISSAAVGSATVTVAVEPTASQGTLSGSKTYFNASNGHYYRLNASLQTYSAAGAAARADTFAGAGGYLAVVRDQTEDDFVRTTILAPEDGTQQVRLAGVRCTAVPTAGTLCSDGTNTNALVWSPGANAPAADTTDVSPTGSGTQSGWTPWYAGQPTNFANENYLSYFYIGGVWRWHDANESTAYTLREYGSSTSFTASTTTAAVTFNDTTAPTVSSFSSTAADGSYKAGDSINVTATTSEAIQSGNTLTVTLDTGATVLLTAASAGTSLTGTYTVGASQTSSDLTVSSFTIGTVADTAGNAMSSTTVPSGVNNIAGAKAIVIDTTPPTVSSFTAVTATPTAALTLTYTLTFSESVTGVTADDFSTTGTATDCTFDPGADSGTTRAVTISGCSDGTVIPRFASGGATDAAGNTGPATAATGSTVTISRNAAPTLATPSTAAFVDSSGVDTFSAATGTLNGADADAGDTLTYSIASGTDGGATVTKTGSYGTLTVTEQTGAYSFAPNATAINALAANASETFTVTVTDGTATTNATFTVSITAVNDVPVVTTTTVSLTDTASADTFSAQTGTLAATDAESNAISSWTIAGGTTGTWTLTWTSGSVTFNRRIVGTYGTLYVESSTGKYRFEPNATAVDGLSGAGSETITVTATDSAAGTGTGSVAVAVTGANDTPTLATPATASYTDTSANDSFSNVTGTLGGADRDTGASLTYGITAGTDDGTTVTKAGTYGTLVVTKASGAYTFTPSASAINARTADVSETFTVSVSDGALSTTATYTVSITAANDTPTLAAVVGPSYNDTPMIDSFANDSGTLAGADLDNGASLTYGITGGTDDGTTVTLAGSYGTLVVTKTTGAYTYTPSASAINALVAAGTDAFTFSVTDGTATATTAYLVSIAGANDTPTLAAVASASYTDTAANDSFSNNTGTLAGADRDAGATLVYGIDGGAGGVSTVTLVGLYGTLVVTKASGAYTYTPSASAINARTTDASESFAMTVTDGTASTSQTYTVLITAANDTPTLSTPATASYTDTSANDSFSNVTGTLGGADRDTGASLTYGITAGTDDGTTVTKAGTYGTLVVTKASGAYTFTPSASAINARTADVSETFTVSVSDGALSTTATYTVSITGANDTPTLAAVTGASYTDTAANDSFSNDTGTLSGADRDTGASLTYGIDSGSASGGVVTKAGTYGTLTVNQASGAYTYTPSASAINARTTDTSESFTVTVTDGTASASQTFTVSITAANDTPTLAAVTGASYTDTATNDTFANDTGTLSGADRDAAASLTYGITGGTASAGVVTSVGTYGTLTVNQTSGAYTYTPSASAINARTTDASESFTLTVTDGTASTSQTYTVSITATNDTPTLASVAGASYTDTAANDTFSNDTGTLSGTDRDTGASLTYGIDAGSASGGVVTKVGSYGTLTVNQASGAYTYTPSASAINEGTTNASDVFTMTVSDGSLLASRTYTVSITAANDAPTLAAVSGVTYTDTAVNESFSNDTGTLVGADRDAGTSLVYGIDAGSASGGVVTKVGTYGTLTVNQASGAYTYTPSASAINARTTDTSESFTLTVTDGTASTPQTYAVSITGANDTPTLASVTGASYTDTAANDSFSNDTGTLSGADRDTGASLTYGIDSGSASGGVVTKAGTYGTLTVNQASGAYTYTPSASAINARTTDASESFTMTVSDGSLSASRTYTVSITGANDLPTLATPATAAFTDTAAADSFGDVSGNLAGSDRDTGATLSYGLTGGTDASTTVSSVGTYGTLTVTKATGAYTFTPTASAINGRTTNGIETFSVTVSDGSAPQSATFTVSVTGTNDTPTLATPTSATYVDTAADDAYTNDAGTLNGADRDAGQTLIYGISGGTDNGATVTKVGTYGTLTVTQATGAYTFAPNASAINARTVDASDSFSVTVGDGTVTTSTVYSVAITAANDTPLLATPTGATYVDTAVDDTFASDSGTLAGTDRDAGAALTYTIVGGVDGATTVALAGSYGTLTVTKATGAYTYTPNAAVINALNAAASESFTLRVSDGVATGSAIYTVSITAVNDTPTLVTPASATYVDTAANDTFTQATGALVGADRDAGATLTYTIPDGTDSGTTVARSVAYGTLTVTKATGAYVFEPNAAAINARTTNDTATITLRVSDGTATTDVTFTVQVTGANDTPVVTTPTGITYTDTSADDTFVDATGTLIASDRDTGQTVTFAVVGGTSAGGRSALTATYGVLSIGEASGAYTYAPNATAINALSSTAGENLTLRVSDGTATVDATFAVAALGTNDTPTLVQPAALSFVDTPANDVFTTRTGSFGGADRDTGAALVYGITSGTDGGGTVSITGVYGTLVVTKATGAWTYTPNRAAINSRTANANEDFTVDVNDGAAAASRTFGTSIAGSSETPVVTWSNPADIYYPTPVDATSHLNAVVTDATTGAAVGGVLTYSTGGRVLSPGTVLDAGTHTLSVEFAATGSTAGDYLSTSSTVTLGVRAEQQSIAVVAPSTREYGDVPTTLAASGYTGFGTITYAVVAGPCSITGAQLQTTGVGNCDVRASITADTNHAAAQSPTFRIAITQALLTVTADAKGKRIATTDPALTFQITGFQRGDAATVLTAPVQISRAAGEDLGTYAITASGAAAANYRFSYVPALLTIFDREVPALAWTQPSAITYGTVLSSTQLAATASYGGTSVAGTFAYTEGSTPVTAGTLLAAGDHLLTATFTPTDTVTFASGLTVQVVLTVQRRALTVTGVTAVDKDYDGQRSATLRTTSAALVGVVGGDAVALDTSLASGLFDAADPGEARVVTVSGLALTGVAQANYSLEQPTVTAAIRAVVPGAPTGASATAGSQQATVTWVAPSFTGGSALTGYTVTAVPGGQTCSWSGGPLSCTVTGLANGTAYTFEVRAVNAVGSSVASTPTASVVPAATVEAIDPDATSVLPNGSVTVQVGCAASARACSATVTVVVGGQTIATGSQQIPAGTTGNVAVALPLKLQRKLAADGVLSVKVVTTIDIDGSQVRVQSTIELTAPPAEAVRSASLRPHADGSAVVTGQCAGTAVSRCEGTITLYGDPSVLDARVARANERVVVGTAKFAGAAGTAVTAKTTLSAAGRKLLRTRGAMRVTPVVTFTGATRLDRELVGFTLSMMNAEQWLRRAMATLYVGGQPRMDLNILLDQAKRRVVGWDVAANRIENTIIPQRERARERVAALPTPPPALRPIVTLLLRAFNQSLQANRAYVDWLRSGRAVDDRGWRISLRASTTKAQLLDRLAQAGKPYGIRVPSATNFWP
jgi:hypothetical protein